MKFLAIVFILFSITSHAESLPSLKAVQGPNWSNTQEMADDTFPNYLEKQGDYTSAILEWRRVMHNSSNKHLHERALLKIAALQQKQHFYHKSIETYQKVLAEFPKTKQKKQVLYQLSHLSDQTANKELNAQMREALKTYGEDDPYLEQAEIHFLWAYALRGEDPNVTSTFFSEKGKQLAQKLADYPVEHSSKVETATLLSLIPGLGHFYLNNLGWGVLVFLLNAAFFFAVITAMKTKHWGYGFAFGILAAVIYVSSMLHAGHLASAKAYGDRINAMETWQELKPQNLEEDIYFKKYRFKGADIRTGIQSWVRHTWHAQYNKVDSWHFHG